MHFPLKYGVIDQLISNGVTATKNCPFEDTLPTLKEVAAILELALWKI